MTSFALYALIGLTAVGAAGVLLIKNVLHAALSLLFTLLMVAGLYVMLQAEYVAVTQIMIYAGGILVIILFGIMLTSRLAGKPLTVESQYRGPAIMLGIGIFIVLIGLGPELPGTFAFLAEHQWQNVGRLLMTEYAFAFELSGILLLVCLIGAAITAIKPPHG